MVYRYVCNGFLRQIRLESYQPALPVPRILRLCNYLQNADATTYILGLQLSTFIFYNKHFALEKFPFPIIALPDKTIANDIDSIFLKLFFFTIFNFLQNILIFFFTKLLHLLHTVLQLGCYLFLAIFSTNYRVLKRSLSFYLIQITILHHFELILSFFLVLLVDEANIYMLHS